MKLINIGFDNMISDERMIALVSPDSAPIKRMIQDAKDKGYLIDATCGRKTKSVIIMDSDHIVLSALKQDKITNRFIDKTEDLKEDSEEIDE